MDCIICKYARSLPGDCHLSCVAPFTRQTIPVKINPHGLANGWANWPLNFDPGWIDECTAFDERDPNVERI